MEQVTGEGGALGCTSLPKIEGSELEENMIEPRSFTSAPRACRSSAVLKVAKVDGGPLQIVGDRLLGVAVDETEVERIVVLPVRRKP